MLQRARHMNGNQCRQHPGHGCVDVENRHGAWVTGDKASLKSFMFHGMF
jgi:hypothetical protein